MLPVQGFRITSLAKESGMSTAIHSLGLRAQRDTWDFKSHPSDPKPMPNRALPATLLSPWSVLALNVGFGDKQTSRGLSSNPRGPLLPAPFPLCLFLHSPSDRELTSLRNLSLHSGWLCLGEIPHPHPPPSSSLREKPEGGEKTLLQAVFLSPSWPNAIMARKKVLFLSPLLRGGN